MRSQRTLDDKKLTIPKAALKLCGLPPGEDLESYTHDSAAVLLKREMTAMDMVQALDYLTALGVELLRAFRQICGDCADCEDSEECPCLKPNRDLPDLPAKMREELGIPADAKLCAFPNRDGTATVMEADHAHDLSDVPDGMMALLSSAGICLCALQEALMADEVVCDLIPEDA